MGIPLTYIRGKKSSSMRKWIVHALVLAVLVTLVILLLHEQNQSAIFLLLAIIFYGLFANPMRHVHPGRSTSRRTKKGSGGRIIINGRTPAWSMPLASSRPNRTSSDADPRLHGLFLFIATVFLAWIVLNSQFLMGNESVNTGLLSYSARASSGLPGSSTSASPVVTLQWTWTAPLDGMRSLALGNNGGTAITGYYGDTYPYSPEAYLFEIPGDGTPAATKLVPANVYLTHNTRVAAAQGADVLARIATEKSSFGSTTEALKIQKFSNGSTQTEHVDWEYSLPGGVTSGIHHLNVRVDHSGGIVSIIQSGGINKGVAFNPGNATGVPDKTFTVSGFSPSIGTALSGDGRWFATVHGSFVYVYDLSPSTPTNSYFSIFNFGGTSLGNQNTCLAFSEDGSAFAIGTMYFNAANPGKVLLYERNAQNQYVLARTISMTGTQSCSALTISSDAKRIALVSHGYTNPISENTVKVQSYRRSGATWGNVPSAEVNYSIPPGPTYTNVATSLGMNASGRRFAVGLTGNGVSPEAYVFDSLLDMAHPIWSADLPGSAYQTEISPSGDTIIVANRTVHVNEVSGSSQLRYYRSG